MPDRTRAVLVRHGETEWSRAGRHTSYTDLDLTDDGRAAAAALAPVLAQFTFARVFVSPMRRSAETARLAGCTGCEVLDELREWNYGDYEGITTAQIRETVPGWTVFTHAAPGGETIEAVATRIDRAIAHVRTVDGDVAVFGHAHALRIFGARWCDLPPIDACHFRLGPASVSVCTYERETPALGVWNWRPDPASD
jgi:probable phosphoglycerate mutase